MKNRLTIKEAITMIEKREITPGELAEYYSKRSTKLNGKLNVYLTLNEKAKEDADESFKKNPGGPLSGLPIVFKDNFLTEGLRTTASSRVLENYIPQYSSTVVKRIIKAGGVVFAKTNMDAWAHGSSTETSDFGASRNPWNTEHLPGGSSGGSAAAVIADMCLAAIGSETAGSVRQPAAWCGCVGLKPTYGRVSRYGVIAMGSSLDCPGPMTRSVEDAAILLEVIAGKDPYDATTSDKKTDNYTDNLNKGVKGLHIGIAEEYLLPEMSNEVKDLVKKAGKVLEDLGAKVDYVKTLNPKYAISVYTIIQRSEVSSNLARYDGIRYGNDRSYFGSEARRRIMLGTYALSAGYADKYYKKAQKVRTLYIKDFEELFKTYDLIIGPTSPGPAQKIGATEGKAMFGEMEDVLVEPSTIAGLPGISLPCGFVDGLPIGLDIFGPQFSEGLVIQAADAYEKATDWHKKEPQL